MSLLDTHNLLLLLHPLRVIYGYALELRHRIELIKQVLAIVCWANTISGSYFL